MIGTNVLKMLICVTLIFPLTGCIQSSTGTGALSCGEGYEEMYGGYDYVYSSKVVNPDNSLNVTIELLKSGGGWLEDNEDYEESQSVWVSLYVQMADGTEIDASYQSAGWEVNGDSTDGTYWSTYLYYESSPNLCDDGCTQVKHLATYEGGVIYYDGTCDSSPWIQID